MDNKLIRLDRLHSRKKKSIIKMRDLTPQRSYVFFEASYDYQREHLHTSFALIFLFFPQNCYYR